jgi:hypothetical protein
LTTQLKLTVIGAATLIVALLIVAYVVLNIWGIDRYVTNRQSYDARDPGMYLTDSVTGRVWFCRKTGCESLPADQKPE